MAKFSDETVKALVLRAYDLKDQIDPLEAQFKELKKDLIEAAKDRRGKENTVRLDGVDVKAVIRFTQSVSFDSAALLDVMLLLGERRFSKVFSTTRVFKARPELEAFLHKKGNVGARRAIASAMTVSDNAPKLTFEEAEKQGR